MEGFDVKAIDYLLKPFSFERFEQAIQHYNSTVENGIKESDETIFPNYIFVRSERMMVKLNFNAIKYIESYSDYLKVHLENKKNASYTRNNQC